MKKKMENEVAVIIPVYNVESKLKNVLNLYCGNRMINFISFWLMMVQQIIAEKYVIIFP